MSMFSLGDRGLRWWNCEKGLGDWGTGGLGDWGTGGLGDWESGTPKRQRTFPKFHPSMNKLNNESNFGKVARENPIFKFLVNQVSTFF